ncbi:DUF805 domain-containing protein [Candidatus Spongiihabitans sp.]|uniref:DUF805 domain-containing protein n=1 Tax=Candidatus Spongiihabitans sp. TaxID=3101308 RepID=UPI003C6F1948
MATASTPDNADDYAAPPRGPIAAVRVCFVKYFAFSGRASRSEFWWFWLFALLMGVALDWFSDHQTRPATNLLAIGWLLLTDAEWNWGAGNTTEPESWLFPAGYYWDLIYPLVYLPILPQIAAGVRRLHDTNRSGWWMLFIVPSLLHTEIGLFANLDLVRSFFDAYTITAVVLMGIFDFLFPMVLLILWALKSNPQENRFDRGQESFGFSFNHKLL